MYAFDSCFVLVFVFLWIGYWFEKASNVIGCLDLQIGIDNMELDLNNSDSDDGVLSRIKFFLFIVHGIFHLPNVFK